MYNKTKNENVDQNKHKRPAKNQFQKYEWVSTDAQLVATGLLLAPLKSMVKIFREY